MLRLRFAPADVFEDPVQKLPYIRGVIVDARPARDVTARPKTVEGSPEYEVVAFDATGERRSRPAALSDAWVHAIAPEINSDIDVRALFSDRDRLAGVALGSRAYFAMARRAADPSGRLGLWRGDVSVPPEPPGVTEGGVIRFLLDPPVFDASGLPTAWTARQRAARMEAVTRALAQRLPTAHTLFGETPPAGLVTMLIDSVARERAYRLSRTGFDRTALSMLVFILDLATVNHRETPAGDQPADMIYFEGLKAVERAIVTIQAATPDSAGPEDTNEMAMLLHRYRAAQDPSEAQRIAAEYEALRARATAERRAACARGAVFCLDPSDRAAVAIDALMASDGLYAPLHLWTWLAEALVAIQTTPPGPRPRRNDRVDIRDAASKLLIQTVNPPPGPNPASQGRRQAYAKEIREYLRGTMFDDHSPPDARVVAREALAAGGWGSPEELASLVKTLIEEGMSYASSAHYGGRYGDMRGGARRCLTHLRALADLAGSQVEHERRAAAEILDHIDRVRRRQKEQGSGPDKIVLEIWDSLASSKRSP